MPAELKTEYAALHTAVLNNLALVQRKRGRHERVVAWCTTALAHDKTNQKALLRRADAHMAMNDVTAAEADVTTLMGLMPTGPVARGAKEIERRVAQKNSEYDKVERAQFAKMFQ